VVNWPLKRLILSYGANTYTRFITGMPFHDSTGGFKCFRREALAAHDLDAIRSDGYAFQIEVTFILCRKGFHITEIPIVFEDRRVGISKMNRRIVWEAVWVVWGLRLNALLGRIR
jgi:dolichol-phosphate mannosyltransferase